jgi:hypothetical protein
MRSRRTVVVAAVLTIALAVVLWRGWGGEAAAVRARLDSLVREVNSESGEGLAMVARAASIGSYFTQDVVIDLGRGTARIEGREMLMGMASRLQRRTSAFEVRLDDIEVKLLNQDTADVRLTASFIQKNEPGDEPGEAREFALVMKKISGSWQISRMTAVETLR